jgi:phospholipase/carboxylesterase
MLDSELIPAAEPPARALLVVLHGLGDSTRGWEWLPDALRLPWLDYRLVNAPDPYYGGHSWYDLHGNPGPGIRRSRILLHELVDAQIAAGWTARQIGLLGFSQGCLMTFDAGWRYPAPLGALVGISGYFHEPETLQAELGPQARTVPALFTHGTRDPLIPLAPVREQVLRFQAAGLDLAWKEFEKVHTVAGESEVAVIRDFLVRHLGAKR